MDEIRKDIAASLPDWLIRAKNLYLVVTKTNGDVVFSNTHYQEVFLVSGAAFSGLNIKDLMPANEISAIMESLQRCTEDGVDYPIQYISRNKIQGKNRFKSIKWECSLIENIGDDESLLLHVGHDMVAVEQAPVSDTHFDKSLNNLFDDLQIGVLVQEDDSSIVLSNTKAEELLGLTKDEMYGRKVTDKSWDIVKADETPFSPEELPTTRAIATKDHIRDVIMGVFNPREGRYVWFQVDANPQLDSDGNLVRVIATFIDISQRKKQEEILKDALKEKTTLLSEIHHRVKNNLAIVSGLLELQSMEMDNENKLPLQRSINRIQSIAMVHELMYQTEKLSSVNIKHYLEQLIPAIHRTMQTKSDVQINLDMQDYMLNINQAIPLGLLMNELLTNSFKYAFLKIFDGKIDIKIAVKGDNLLVVYEDNGPGFKPGNDFYNSSSLGLSLIHAQLEQLHADFKVVTEGRFALEFTFQISGRGSHSNI